MANTEATTARPASARTRELERYCAFLRRGAPGPHAYVALLGLEAFDAPHVLRAARRGLSYRSFERLVRSTGLPVDILLALVDVPRRTLTRRKREGRFLPEESDRLLRASRVFGRVLALFEGDRDAANEWLAAAQPALGGATPLATASSEVGALEVERLILRLEHGVFS